MKKLEVLKKIINKKLDFIKKINDVLIDSRKIKRDDVFIAIRGGNKFVKKVLEKGASIVIYDDKTEKINDKRAILVEDSIEFLQEFAKNYRTSLDVLVVGITGSEGKTSTKDILYSILSSKYKGKKTQGNYNNHLGVPLTLLTIEEDDKFLALEMGMSDLGEIRLLSEIAKPNYAIITNIGDSHLEFLKTRDNVFLAKTEIFDFVKKENRVVYGDDLYFEDIEAVKIGKRKNNNYQLSKFEQNKNGSNFMITFEKEKIQINTNLYGEYNSINIGLAIVVGMRLGVETEKIIEVCKKLKLSGMRFERIEKKNKVFINDAYNASPVAMEVSLKTFDEIFKGEYKVAILGDMLELGENSKKLHEKLSTIIEKSELNELYLIGENMKCLFEKLNFKNSYFFENIDEIKNKVSDLSDGVVIFMKASNGMSLNKILD